MNDTMIEGVKIEHEQLLMWIKDTAELCQPDRIYVCDGSQSEYDRLCDEMVQSGTFIRLNEEKRPNSFLCRSDPRDVARVEGKTYVCSLNKADAGPTNNWIHPLEMKERLNADVPVKEVDLHLNTPEFGQEAVELFDQLYRKSQKK